MPHKKVRTPSSGRNVWLFPLLLLLGCGGGESPVQTDDVPPVSFQVTSGRFDVTAYEIFDTCDRNEAYDGAYEITIDTGSFSMGGEWTGTWDEKAARGSAESAHETETFRECTVTRWTSVTVTFSSADEFEGSISFRRRVSGECDEPCLTTWGISGTRQPTTP